MSKDYLTPPNNIRPVKKLPSNVANDNEMYAASCPVTQIVVSECDELPSTSKSKRTSWGPSEIISSQNADVTNNSIKMLGVVISTIMMMAAKLPEIPEEYLIWTKSYLKCVTNEHGEYPANIRKILKLISREEEILARKKCECPSVSIDF